MKVAVISTMLPGLKDRVVAKTLRVLDERLAPAGATVVLDRRVPHEPLALRMALEEVRETGADLVIVFGASAIADRRDVVPASIVAAGGHIEHFGMPVDPGNLLLIGELGGRPVLGAPGCARSPKENGFDWVLHRLLAGLPVGRADITALGVGGLLVEIVTRPQPRGTPVSEPDGAPGVAAIVLAAGRSTRMGGPNKLLAGDRRAIAGANRGRGRLGLKGLACDRCHRPPGRGCAHLPLRARNCALFTTPILRTAFRRPLLAEWAPFPLRRTRVVICLGDMPGVDGALIDRLIGAFEPAKGALIAVPAPKASAAIRSSSVGDSSSPGDLSRAMPARGASSRPMPRRSSRFRCRARPPARRRHAEALAAARIEPATPMSRG